MARIHLAIFGLLAACGGTTTNGSLDAPVALTCRDLAFCASIDVKTFTGSIDAPGGGPLHDGIYRLAWKVTPATDSNEPAGYHDQLEVLRLGGTSFVSGRLSSNRGTFATTGHQITFTETTNCELGTDGSSSTVSYTDDYTATASQLILFEHVSSGTTQWQDELVYLPVGAASDACATVTDEPTSPGDSAQCHVSNCYCNVTAGGTIDQSVCQ